MSNLKHWSNSSKITKKPRSQVPLEAQWSVSQWWGSTSFCKLLFSHRSSPMFISFLWSMIGDISFLVILGLVSLQTPHIVQRVNQALMTFIYFDILQTNTWMPQFLQIDTSDDDGISPLFSNGYSSMHLSLNLASAFVYIKVIAVFTFFACMTAVIDYIYSM